MNVRLLRFLENCRFDKQQITEGEVRSQEIRNRRKSIWYIWVYLGIRTNMPQRNDDELKKVTQMVKEKNYKHKELGVLKH